MSSPGLCVDTQLRENEEKSRPLDQALQFAEGQLDITDISRQKIEQTKSRKAKGGSQKWIEKRKRIEDLKKEHIAVTIYCKNCGYRYVAALKCRNWRLCEYCRLRELIRVKAAYIEIINSIPKERLRLITVTTRNVQELSGKDIQKIREYWIRLLHRKHYARSIVGGLYSIEVVNKGRGWNIHLHSLLEVKHKNLLLGSKKGEKHTKDEEKLSKDWSKVTGRTAKIVDILPVFSPRGGLSYVVKYLSKRPGVNGQFYTYNEVLRGSRLLSSFGLWYSKAEYRPGSYVFVCPVCGGIDWISEFEMRSIENELFEAKARSP